jgi:hypothetical protein
MKKQNSRWAGVVLSALIMMGTAACAPVLDPNSDPATQARIYLRDGLEAIDRGEIELAEQNLRSALRNDPRLHQARTALASLHARLAGLELDQYFDLFVSASQDIQHQLRLVDGIASDHLRAGVGFLRALATAVHAFERMPRIYPENRPMLMMAVQDLRGLAPGEMSEEQKIYMAVLGIIMLVNDIRDGFPDLLNQIDLQHLDESCFRFMERLADISDAIRSDLAILSDATMDAGQSTLQGSGAQARRHIHEWIEMIRQLPAWSALSMVSTSIAPRLCQDPRAVYRSDEGRASRSAP